MFDAAIRRCKKISKDANFLNGYKQGIVDMASLKDSEIEALKAELEHVKAELQKCKDELEVSFSIETYSDEEHAWVPVRIK